MGQQGGDYGASTEAFDRALAIARREQDVSLELRTLAAASYVDWFHLRPNSCIDKSQRVLEIGQQIDDPSVQTLAHYGSVYSLCEIGNISEARQHAAACLEAGEKFQDRFWLPAAWPARSRKPITTFWLTALSSATSTRRRRRPSGRGGSGLERRSSDAGWRSSTPMRMS